MEHSKKVSRQQVYTLLVQVGRKDGDGLPEAATGGALVAFSSGVDEAEAEIAALPIDLAIEEEIQRLKSERQPGRKGATGHHKLTASLVDAHSAVTRFFDFYSFANAAARAHGPQAACEQQGVRTPPQRAKGGRHVPTRAPSKPPRTIRACRCR